MSKTRKYSLVIGGLPSAADMPELAHQVVPRAVDIDQAAKALLDVAVEVTGGQSDPKSRLWFEGAPDEDTPRPRRYAVETSEDVAIPELFSALVRAVLDVAPLPSGIVTNWTEIIVLEDDAGNCLARTIVEVPRGGGRRRFLSSSGMGGIALGGLAGAAVAGPVGAAVGMVIGGVAGEALERAFPSDSEKTAKTHTP